MTCFPRTTSLPAGARGVEGGDVGERGRGGKKKTQLCRKTNQKTQKMRRELPEPKQQNQEDIHITAPRSERLLALIEYVSI